MQLFAYLSESHPTLMKMLFKYKIDAIEFNKPSFIAMRENTQITYDFLMPAVYAIATKIRAALFVVRAIIQARPVHVPKQFLSSLPNKL